MIEGVCCKFIKNNSFDFLLILKNKRRCHHPKIKKPPQFEMAFLFFITIELQKEN